MKTKRESRYVKVARIAYQIARETLPLYRHAKSPHRYTQPQLVACLLMAFYVNKSYRDTEEWLLASEALCQALELKEVPHYSTLARTFQHLTLEQMTRMRDRLLRALEGKEAVVSVDTTSFRFGQASAYFLTRSGRRYRHWLKGGYAVGRQSQMIVGWRTTPGKITDFRLLAPLRCQAARYGTHERQRRTWILLGDAGFDARDVSAYDIIPPLRRNAPRWSPERQARREMVWTARLDGLYGQRWKSETVNSVIKRKFGDSIRSRRIRLQHREPIIKALVYDFHV
jgi:hypothetical protein